jgi:2-haloacid dehalogenase
MDLEKIFVFDAYGTLFDVDASCRELSQKIGNEWENLSNIWRLKQIQYTWLRNSMDDYVDFWQITKDALDFAMETLSITDNKLREDLLLLYLKLKAYPEVKSVLISLKSMGIKTVILSNGNKKMLTSAILNAGIKNLIDEVLSADDCGVYKPSKRVYDLVENKMGVNKKNILFFSSNAWDVHAASKYGFKTIWVNRFDSILEKLPGKPDHIINSLEQIKKMSEN